MCGKDSVSFLDQMFCFVRVVIRFKISYVSVFARVCEISGSKLRRCEQKYLDDGMRGHGRKRLRLRPLFERHFHNNLGFIIRG